MHWPRQVTNGAQFVSFLHEVRALFWQSPASTLRRHWLHALLAALLLQRLLAQMVLQSPGVVQAHVVSLARTEAAASGYSTTRTTGNASAAIAIRAGISAGVAVVRVAARVRRHGVGRVVRRRVDAGIGVVVVSTSARANEHCGHGR
jgi:hypothetical protein